MSDLAVVLGGRVMDTSYGDQGWLGRHVRCDCDRYVAGLLGWHWQGALSPTGELLDRNGRLSAHSAPRARIELRQIAHRPWPFGGLLSKYP